MNDYVKLIISTIKEIKKNTIKHQKKLLNEVFNIQKDLQKEKRENIVIRILLNKNSKIKKREKK